MVAVVAVVVREIEIFEFGLLMADVLFVGGVFAAFE